MIQNPRTVDPSTKTAEHGAARPIAGPKPAIASKPKFIPPVNTKKVTARVPADGNGSAPHQPVIRNNDKCTVRAGTVSSATLQDVSETIPPPPGYGAMIPRDVASTPRNNTNNADRNIVTTCQNVNDAFNGGTTSTKINSHGYVDSYGPCVHDTYDERCIPNAFVTATLNNARDRPEFDRYVTAGHLQQGPVVGVNHFQVPGSDRRINTYSPPVNTYDHCQMRHPLKAEYVMVGGQVIPNTGQFHAHDLEVYQIYSNQYQSVNSTRYIIEQEEKQYVDSKYANNVIENRNSVSTTKYIDQSGIEPKIHPQTDMSLVKPDIKQQQLQLQQQQQQLQLQQQQQLQLQQQQLQLQQQQQQLQMQQQQQQQQQHENNTETNNINKKSEEKTKTQNETNVTKSNEKSQSSSKENSGPSSPSTVCCSILSNATTSDCCGMLSNSAYKKELNNKTTPKVDSADSVSSDSGGFKEFISRESEMKRLEAEQSKALHQDYELKWLENEQNKEVLPKEYAHFTAEIQQVHTHQRKVSQPDFPVKPITQHQRKVSQPEFLEHSVAERAQLLKQSLSQQKSVPQPEYISQENRNIVGQNRQIFAANQHMLLQQTAQNMPPPRAPMPVRQLPVIQKQLFAQNIDQNQQNVEPNRQKQPSPLISQGQFQQSTKKIEELLAQRVEKEKQQKLKKIGVLAGDGEGSSDIEQQITVQKQIQQKLQADLKQHVKQIQELHNTELRLPQNRQWSAESNRSQPAIGLKYTPKARPTIFGTVASDHTPKDGANRRSLPQTPQSSKSFSALYNGEHGGISVESSENEITPDNALVYRDGNLISGPLEALIQHMVPTNQYYPDRAYLFAFLLSSRLFIKPHELLAQIWDLCYTQQHLTESILESTGKPLDQTDKSHSGSTDLHSQDLSQPSPQFTAYLIQLLAEWTETFPYDFRDERVMQHVRNITQKCVALNTSLRKDVSGLLQNLLQRLTTLESYEEFLQKMSNPDQTDIDSSVDITEICPNSGILAQQLTHIELERLSYIGPEEFVQAFAKENPHLETSFKDMKKTRNLESYVQWFNRLSYLVATEVCKYPKKKQRVRVVEYWIETARECFNIGNFNSLMAIIAGLNMSPISRLKKTWSKIQSGKFSILEHQMDPSSNFSSYRSTLKAAMWRSAGARDERQRIVIPFFSLLVKDLYFLNEGCSNKLPNGHINFEKFWQLAKQVTEFMAWKQVTCPFEKNARVITLLQTSSVLNENALALASFECEQPENNQERERYKTLKSELNSS